MANKRTEHQIVKDFAAAKAVYHESAQTATGLELATMSADIKALTIELSAYLTEGAEPCPVCGEKPHGIHQPAYYEVGCLIGCQFEVDGKSYLRRAKGGTREEAVENWNNQEYFAK